jgi:hypothetical protein
VGEIALCLTHTNLVLGRLVIGFGKKNLIKMSLGGFS